MRLFIDTCLSLAVIALGLSGLQQSRQLKALTDTIALDHKLTEIMLKEIQELKLKGR